MIANLSFYSVFIPVTDAEEGRVMPTAELQELVVFEREDETTMRFGDAPPILPPALGTEEGRRQAFQSASARPTFGDRWAMSVPLRFDEDLRPEGAPMGDNEPVGSFEATATITEAGPTFIESWFLVTAVIKLPDGSLAKQAHWSPQIFGGGRVGFRLAGPILGGTGVYAGAVGEWHLIGLSQNSGKLVYRFKTLTESWPPED